MTEIWKDIQGYEGWYQVSNLGRVKSLRRRHRSCKRDIDIQETEKIIKPTYCGKKRNYLCVRLCSDNCRKSVQVHRLVASTFISNPNNYEQVDHINRNTKDNRVENLRWVTQSENQYNTPKNHLLEYNGETKPLGKWAIEKGLSYSCLSNRIRSGWSIERALETPTNIKMSLAKRKVG